MRKGLIEPGVKETLDLRTDEELDRLRAEHLSMTYEDYVARKDLLLRQIGEMKDREEPSR